jgi:Domain of unknown function (DUF5666)
MKKYLLTIAACGLFATFAVATAQAQDSTSTTTNAPAKHKKHDVLPFHGKVSAIDASAMTLTVGERTFEITSETKITKDGKPATLADGTVGEMAGGAYKKGADGKLTATSIHFGAKEKKHKETGSEGTSTNSVPN